MTSHNAVPQHLQVAKFLKEQTDGIARCYVVEPHAAPVMALQWGVAGGDEGVLGGAHKVQGGGYSKNFLDLPLFNEEVAGVNANNLIDGFLQVTDAEVRCLPPPY
jgi:hypothetical protein